MGTRLRPGPRPPGSDTATIPLLGPGPGFNRAYAMITDLTQPVIIATLLPITGDVPAPLAITTAPTVCTRRTPPAPRSCPPWVLTETETLTIRAQRGSRAARRPGTGRSGR